MFNCSYFFAGAGWRLDAAKTSEEDVDKIHDDIGINITVKVSF
jgi:hypothetical protein